MLPKWSWAFRFICPPLSEPIPDRTQNIFGVNCWQLLLLARHSDLLPLHYHYVIITLSLHHSLHYLWCPFFTLSVSFTVSIFAVGRSPAARCVAGVPSVVPRPSLGPRGNSPLLFGVARSLRDGSFGTRFEGTSHRLV